MTGKKPLFFAKRSNRRALVVALFLSCAGLLFFNYQQGLFQAVLTLALLPLSIASLAILLMPHLTGTSDGGDHMLDERQLQVRNRAYLQAYRILAFSLLMFNLYLYFADGRGWWVPQFQQQTGLWVLMVLVVGLPPALMAWIEPEPLAD